MSRKWLHFFKIKILFKKHEIRICEDVANNNYISPAVICIKFRDIVEVVNDFQ